MADLIERDAVISKIKSCISLPVDNEWDAGYNTAMAEAKQYLQNAPAVNRWIPVEDALPEVYEKVLTYSDDGIIHDNFRLNLRDGSVGWSQGWGVTHWQPRPEPPEREVET